MDIIDVDSHFEPAPGWLEAFPELKGRFPDLLPDDDPRFALDSAEMFAYFVSDDLLRHVPVDQRMGIDRLTTPAMEALFSDQREELVYPGANQHKPLVDADARVAWMDEQGISAQAVISGDGYTLARAIRDPELGWEAVRAVNTWMSEALASTGGRLMPVTSLRFDDLDLAVEELTRMRARGSRSFLIWSEPVNGVPPNHPDYDRLWSAATDLGMVAHLHIGMSPALIHPGWANTDNPSIIRLLSVLQPQQTAEILLNAMVFGGVFERHPKLTVLISELGIDWVPKMVEKMDSMAGPFTSPLVLGSYDLPLQPSEYVDRNLRISPLPADREPPGELLEALPGSVVFSSDYPHFEGNPDPVGYYKGVLADTSVPVVEGFLGGNIRRSFEMMGDPLPSPLSAEVAS